MHNADCESFVFCHIFVICRRNCRRILNYSSRYCRFTQAVGPVGITSDGFLLRDQITTSLLYLTNSPALIQLRYCTNRLGTLYLPALSSSASSTSAFTFLHFIYLPIPVLHPSPHSPLLLTFIYTTCLLSFSSAFLLHGFSCSSLSFLPPVFCPSRLNSFTTVSPAPHFPFYRLSSVLLVWIPSPRFLLFLTFLLTNCLLFLFLFFFVSCSYLSVSSCFITSFNTNAYSTSAITLLLSFHRWSCLRPSL